jgi:hypothetical protein
MMQQRQQQASNTCCMTSQYLSECIRNQRTSKVLDDPNAEHTNSHRDETFEKLRVSCLPSFPPQQQPPCAFFFTCFAGAGRYLRQNKREDPNGDSTACPTKYVTLCLHRALLLSAAEAW